MPTVNIFYSDKNLSKQLDDLVKPLKECVAQQLTCGDIRLNSNEVSIRFITTSGSGLLAPLEVEITAASFKERVEKQDAICLNIQNFILEKINSLKDVKVWLILSELGHSWE